MLENSNAKVVKFGSEMQLSGWMKGQQSKPMVIRINAQTRSGQLFDNLHVLSEQTPRFGRKTTELQQALLSGQPVVFLGVEKNPVLQQVLESLFCVPPSVMINGSLLEFPEADISLLWPASEKSHSTLLAQVIQSAESCMDDIDIWDSAAARYGINRASLPEQELKAVYAAYASLPKNLKNHPGKLQELTSSLLDNLITAALQAQQVEGEDHLGPAHWRKAINSVLTHRTRHNPGVRDFMKVICERLFPDPDNQNWVDREQLADIFHSATHVNREFVERHFWRLARAFGPGAFARLRPCFKHPEPIWTENPVMDVMCALLVSYGPENMRHGLASTLLPKRNLMNCCQNIPDRSLRRIKRLEDALASGWGFRKRGGCRAQLINIAATCYAIANNAKLDEQTRRNSINDKLDEALVWGRPGEAPLARLSDDLLFSKANQADREKRRLNRLKTRLSESPVVFIQGETGTGKSFFAAQMAQAAGHHWLSR